MMPSGGRMRPTGMALPALALLLTLVGPAIASEPAPAGTPEAAPDAGEGERQVVLYYFHGNRRCNTCRKIESYAFETADSWHRKQLESGELTWKVVNYEEAEQRHFAKEFGLFSASLVLVETRNGETVRHEVLQKVWTLVRDKPEFERYVRKALDRYLD